MPVMETVITMVDSDETIVCQGCGVTIPAEMDYESFFSQTTDNDCGHILADSGNYCDDCYPSCRCDEY